MSSELVSIVTPCYNGEKYIERFLNSIIHQTYSSLELVLINDGSTDRTEEIVNEYRDKLEQRGIRFVYEYQENAGQAAALNRGLKLFTGRYLMWMDSDDEILPEAIEKRVEFLQNNPQYVFCYGKAISVVEENPQQIVEIYEKRTKNGRYDFFEGVLYSRGVFFSGYMVLTSALDKVIIDREIYTGKGGQNAQLLLPLAWHYGEPGYVEESIYKYYIRENSHSHSQNTSEKIIQQFYNYEKILLETLKKIEDKNVQKYEKSVQKYYAGLRFGNAVDTKKVELIRKCYFEMKNVGRVTWHEFLLYVKYTNPIMRKLFHVGK